MVLATFLVAMTLAVQTPEQRLGTFTIAGQTFTAIVQNQTQLEIRDASSAVQYEKTIQPGVTAAAKLAFGDGLAGLLMHYTKDSGESWQLFRLRDGKLALFDAPMNSPPVTAGAIVPGGRVNTRETIDLRVWSGNFYVIVPVRVNWQQGRTAPGQQCFELAGASGMAETG